MRMLPHALPWLAVVILGACGGKAGDTPAAAAGIAGDSVAPATPSGSVMPAPAGNAAPASPGSASSASAPAFGGGVRELVNPDAPTMVFLYHALSGVAPPLDQWVENDSRVTSAPGAQKAAQRDLVRAELLAAMSAVQGTGFLRLTLHDELSEYDATYGEFTLRSLAPSSTVPYRALQQEVGLRFGNGRDAQVWAVPAAQAQTVQDSFRFGRSVVLDLLVKIAAVQPAPRGGTLVADVLEYEIRTQHGSQLLGRVRLQPP